MILCLTLDAYKSSFEFPETFKVYCMSIAKTSVKVFASQKVLHKQGMKSFAYRESAEWSHVSLLAFFFFAGLGAWVSSGISDKTQRGEWGGGIRPTSRFSSHMTFLTNAE